jgi:hypothetical protein
MRSLPLSLWNLSQIWLYLRGGQSPTKQSRALSVEQGVATPCSVEIAAALYASMTGRSEIQRFRNEAKSEVSRLKASFSGIIFGFISVAIGCVFLAGTWGAYLGYNRVQEYSGRATAYVTKKHFQTAGDGSGNYYLDYWFVPSIGSKLSASNGISKQQWDTLQVGDTLEIRYDQSNPNRCIPVYGNSPSLVMAFFMLVLGAVFIAFGVSRFLTSFNTKLLSKNKISRV